MPNSKRYLFVSYAREDVERVRPLVDAVRNELASRALPVDVWMDIWNLRPGEHWNAAISEALKASIGFLFFLSESSLHSDWVRRQVDMAATAQGRLILPVILHERWTFTQVRSFIRELEGSLSTDGPPPLGELWFVRYVGHPSRENTARAAAQIADETEKYLHTSPQLQSGGTHGEASAIAADIANDVRSSVEPAPGEGSPESVFVVHGHDSESLTQLEQFLTSVGVEAIVLSRKDESPQSLFQKFMTIGNRARFAIVLLCADDYGAARRQYDTSGVSDRALQFRARQNVILELGFFYGKLGWESVFVVHKNPDRVFPNFERPSDLDGVVFDTLEDFSWRKKLAEKLSAAGFELRRPA